MASRPRRANAGANMAKLINQAEDEDDFYKENYGGFNEVEDDSDFAQSEKSDDDIVDSDFDLSENEPEQDDEAQEKEIRIEERAVKRKAQVYKDPKVHKPPVRRKKMSDVNNLPKKTPSKAPTQAQLSSSRSLRRSTQQTTTERLEREARAKRKKQKKRPRARDHDEAVKMTQEELMEEAKITEVENTLWLEKFKNLEVEKTKRRPKRDFKESKDFTIQQFGYLEHSKDETGSDKSVIRSVVSFPSEATMGRIFPKQDRLGKAPDPAVCWVTGLPAKYKDPITGLPYYNIQAFQVIRKLYYRYLEKSPQFRDNERVKDYLNAAPDGSERLRSFNFGNETKPRYRYDLNQEYNSEKAAEKQASSASVQLNIRQRPAGNPAGHAIDTAGVQAQVQPNIVPQAPPPPPPPTQALHPIQFSSANAQPGRQSFAIQPGAFPSPQKTMLQKPAGPQPVAQAPQTFTIQQGPAGKQTIQLTGGQTVQIQGQGGQLQAIQLQPGQNHIQLQQAGGQQATVQLPVQQPASGQAPVSQPQSQTRTVYITAVVNNDNANIIPRQPE